MYPLGLLAVLAGANKTSFGLLLKTTCLLYLLVLLVFTTLCPLHTRAARRVGLIEIPLPGAKNKLGRSE